MQLLYLISQYGIGFSILFLSLIAYLQNRYFFRKDFEWQTSDYNTQEKRKAWWIHDVISNVDTMDEVSLLVGISIWTRNLDHFLITTFLGAKRSLKWIL